MLHGKTQTQILVELVKEFPKSIDVKNMYERECFDECDPETLDKNLMFLIDLGFVTIVTAIPGKDPNFHSVRINATGISTMCSIVEKKSC